MSLTELKKQLKLKEEENHPKLVGGKKNILKNLQKKFLKKLQKNQKKVLKKLKEVKENLLKK